MHNFMVTYRRKDGTQAKESLTAESRSDVFAQLKAQGIVPIAVTEAGALPKTAAVWSRGSLARGLAAGVLLVVLSLAAWWFLARETPQPVMRTAEARNAQLAAPQAKPRRPKRPVEPSAKPMPMPVPEAPVAVKPQNRHMAPGTVLNVATNDNGFEITWQIGANGRTNVVTKALREPVFKHPTDQIIAAAMNAAMNGQMAPLPPMGRTEDIQFRRSLEDPILDNEDDPDEVRRIKQSVREARQEIAALMDQGQTLSGILTQHRELWNENIRIRDEIKGQYRKIAQSGDEEAARDYLSKMNESLGKLGIAPIIEGGGKRRRRKVEE